MTNSELNLIRLYQYWWKKNHKFSGDYHDEWTAKSFEVFVDELRETYKDSPDDENEWGLENAHF